MMSARANDSLWDAPVVSARRPSSRVGLRGTPNGQTQYAGPQYGNQYGDQYTGQYGDQSGDQYGGQYGNQSDDQYGQPESGMGGPGYAGYGEEPGYAPVDQDIYSRAINVSSPRLVDEPEDSPLPTIQKKLVRRVEVPYTRKVKVPTQTTKIVETMVPQKVPTTRLVSVPGFKMHPQVRGLDEDTSVPAVAPSRGVQPLSNSRGYSARGMPGPVSMDPYGGMNGMGATQARSMAPGGDSFYRRSAALNSALPSAAGSLSLRGYAEQPPQPAYDHSGFTDPANIRPAGGYRRNATYETQPNLARNRSMEDGNEGGGGIGMTVKNTHTRHTDGTGVLVTRVDRGTPAARAGLQANDIITAVANIPTTTVDEFRAVMGRNAGPLELLVNRDGRRNVSLTLYR